MKKLRQYRIPITEEDGVTADILVDGRSIKEQRDFHLINLSSSGIGIGLASGFSFESIFEVKLAFKNYNVTAKGKLARRYPSKERENHEYVGVEFLEVDSYALQTLIYELIKGMNQYRLRSLLMDMIQNEGIAIHNDEDELEVSAPILVDIFNMFQKYNSSYHLMFLFAQEVRRTIGAKDFRFYTFENDNRDVSIFNFETGVPSKSVLPILGKIKEVKDSRNIYSSRLSKTIQEDEFYNLLQTLYDVSIDTFILAPVIDKSGHMVGILEFSNKENHELFSPKDKSEVLLLSTILGLTFSLNYETESYSYVHDLIDQYNEGILIGASEENRYVNSFIQNCAKTNDPVLITGEFGVGKKLVAVNIHNKSERSQYGLGHINSHDVEDIKSLKNMLYTFGAHIGAFELYTGGTIVFKDINFLSFKTQKFLYNELSKRSDIRFIATSSVTLEALKHRDDVFWPLIDFFSAKKIRVPSLNERKDDIIPLAHYFTYILCQENGLAPKTISGEVFNHFKSYDWPGNISELKIALERLIILGHDLKSLFYKKTRVVPILDREIDEDFTYGLDLSHDLIGQTQLVSSSDFEILYFYFYVDSLLEKGHFELFELSDFFHMEGEEFYEKLFHAHEKAISYFGNASNLIDGFLTEKAA